jgi:hypothetical protein
MHGFSFCVLVKNYSLLIMYSKMCQEVDGKSHKEINSFHMFYNFGYYRTLVSLVSLEKPHNPSGLARAVVIVPSGARVLQDRDNRVCVMAATVYQRERGSRRFGRNLDSGRRGASERSWKRSTTCVWRRLAALYGVTRSWCLALAWATLCLGAPTMISRNLAWF